MVWPFTMGQSSQEMMTIWCSVKHGNKRVFIFSVKKKKNSQIELGLADTFLHYQGETETLIENLPEGPEKINLAPDGSFLFALLQISESDFQSSFNSMKHDAQDL